ncbi:MAG: methyltransferase domain-containing protein [Pelistega sp.]|nr:methyltransferase domain-containing protein [Pelistega sp.]
MDKQLAQQFYRWLASPKGQDLLRQEQVKTEPIIANTFGYLALQIGLPHIDYLANNRTRKKLILSSFEADAHTYKYPCIETPANHIPLDEQSTDLIILPHTLELSHSPEAIIKEAHRVLIHEGKLLITGFNPWHIGMFRYLYQSSSLPLIPYKHLLSIHKIKDWFTLHGFEVNPQHTYTSSLHKDGMFYVITAHKRSAGMHLISPAIPKKSKANVNAAVVTQQANKHEY